MPASPLTLLNITMDFYLLYTFLLINSAWDKVYSRAAYNHWTEFDWEGLSDFHTAKSSLQDL